MILLIANSRDFATDYIVAELRRRQREYFRLDTDLCALDAIALDPVSARLLVSRNGMEHVFTEANVEAILYRAPTHLSESGGRRTSPEERLADHQWAAFARSLVVFRSARWVNHPQQTYLAENKPHQLRMAHDLGFKVPATIATNDCPASNSEVWNPDEECAVKALDTFVLSSGDEDLFFYMQTIERAELASSSMRAMPMLIQRVLRPKVDLRVTVIGDRCFPVEILKHERGIDGDWRIQKSDLAYRSTSLPTALESACVRLVRDLGLAFGAIDLARVGDEFYFLEVNPTGEWAWLVDAAGLPLDRVLADLLCKPRDAR